VVSLLGFLSGVAFVFYLDKTMDTHPGEMPPTPSNPAPDDKP